MFNKFLLVLVLVNSLITTGCSQVKAPAPHGPVPSDNQMRWQEMEYYAFIHFSTNTFTNEEWGFGTDTDMQLFNPTELDARQWARICKEVGMIGYKIVGERFDIGIPEMYRKTVVLFSNKGGS